mgnify:CR=1 FL=1
MKNKIERNCNTGPLEVIRRAEGLSYLTVQDVKDLKNKMIKTKTQRMIEYQVTGGRGYGILPSDNPIFYIGDSLRVWLFFAEKRDKFNVSEISTNHYTDNRIPLMDFLSSFSNGSMIYNLVKGFTIRNGREVEQITKHLKS